MAVSRDTGICTITCAHQATNVARPDRPTIVIPPDADCLSHRYTPPVLLRHHVNDTMAAIAVKFSLNPWATGRRNATA